MGKRKRKKCNVVLSIRRRWIIGTWRREEQRDLALLLAVFLWRQRRWDGGERKRAKEKK